MCINIRFTEEDWQRTQENWKRWWAGELDRPLLVVEVVEPSPNNDPSQLTKWGLETPVDTVLDNATRLLEATHWLGDAYPKWWINFGPGIVAGFLGCKVSYTPDTTWFAPLEGVERLEEIHPAYDPQNPWWQRVICMTERALERWGDQVVMGSTDLGGNLDILASLRGSQKLLLDTLDNPDEVERLTKEITPLWLRYFEEHYAIITRTGRGTAWWSPHLAPGKGYMLQCDFSYMISPKMFTRFVLPDLVTCCEQMDYAFYHLDGKGELAHLDQILSIPRLRGVQWVPGDGAPQAEAWPEVLEHISSRGKLVQVTANAQGALQIKRELGGKGMIIYIANESFTPEEGRAFVEAFEAE